MSTHRVTLDLPQHSYERLRQMVDSGEYASESDVVAVLLGSETGEWIPPRDGRSYEEWLRESAAAAYDENAANPSEVYTAEQVLAYLAEERRLTFKAR